MKKEIYIAIDWKDDKPVLTSALTLEELGDQAQYFYGIWVIEVNEKKILTVAARAKS